MFNKIPAGCYPSEVWECTFEEEGNVIVDYCVQYVRASDGEVMGTLVVTHVNGDYIGSEFAAWDDL